MNTTIRKIFVSGLGVMMVAGAFTSVPAVARGDYGQRFFFNFGDFASSMMDNSETTGGTVVSSTPLQPYNKPCHNETRKLYDDNDNVVAHQVVMGKVMDRGFCESGVARTRSPCLRACVARGHRVVFLHQCDINAPEERNDNNISTNYVIYSC